MAGNQDFVRYSLALESTWLPVPFTPHGNSRTTLKSFTKVGEQNTFVNSITFQHAMLSKIHTS